MKGCGGGGASHPGTMCLYSAPRGSPGTERPSEAGGRRGLRAAEELVNLLACNRLGTDSSTGRAGDS
jgi:hypothetical protein